MRERMIRLVRDNQGQHGLDLHRFCSGLFRAILAIKGRTMRPTDMAAIHSDDFKRAAVRVAQTSGLTRRQVASDLGIGHSTLGMWARMFSEEAKVPAQDVELLRKNERLRKENRILRDLSRNKKVWGTVFRRMCEVPKKAAIFFAAQKAVRFQYIAEYRGSLTRSHLCRLTGVSERRLHA